MRHLGINWGWLAALLYLALFWAGVIYTIRHTGF